MTTFIYTYNMFGVVMPCTVAVLLLILAFMLSKHFFQKKYSGTVCLAPFVCLLIVFLFFLINLSPGYRFPIAAVIQQNDNKYITVGYVDKIADAPIMPVYYDSTSHQWSTGRILTVGGNQYYIPFGNVNVGDAVELLWGGSEKIVYDYSLREAIFDEEIGTQLISTRITEKPNADIKFTGKWVITVSIIVYAAFVFLQHPVGKAISGYLEKKDRKTTNMITPSIIGASIFAVLQLPIAGVVAGLVMLGFREMLLIYIPTLCIWLVLIIRKTNTKLLIDHSTVTIKVLKATKSFKKDDIMKLRFGPSRLPHNRCLVITLYNGQEFDFEQQDFWGLSNAYLTLSKDGNGDKWSVLSSPPQDPKDPK